jgi:ribosomal protein S18 acetylase RimI-like enzyme
LDQTNRRATADIDRGQQDERRLGACGLATCEQIEQSELVSIAYEWRGTFANPELESLHGEGFDHDPGPDIDWRGQLHRHSLGWVCAREDAKLVGFVNVPWDGSSHAFILDTVVAGTHRHRGVGTELVAVAAHEAATAGCEWLHVDFEHHLQAFYFDTCGFKRTDAGLLRLRGGSQ